MVFQPSHFTLLLHLNKNRYNLRLNVNKQHGGAGLSGRSETGLRLFVDLLFRQPLIRGLGRQGSSFS